MSDESVHPILNTDSVIKKVLDIHNNNPFLLPSEDEIHKVFEGNNLRIAKELYESFDGSIMKAAKSDYVDPSDPNLPKIVSGCSESCSRGNCNQRCQNAIRIFNQLHNQQQMAPGGGNEAFTGKVKRKLAPQARELNLSLKNGRLKAEVDEIESDIENEIATNPDNAAFAINKMLRTKWMKELFVETGNMKERILSQNALSPYSYTESARKSRQNVFGRGAASQDVATALLRNKHVGDVLGDVNNIMSMYQKNGNTVDDNLRYEIGKFMDKTNNHVFGFHGKSQKLISDNDFLSGYIAELDKISSKYNKLSFDHAFRDGTPKAETDIQNALKDISPGSSEAVKMAMNDMGDKIHKDGYAQVFKNGVDAYLSKNADNIIKTYANRTTPEERQELIAQIHKKSPYLQNKMKEMNDENLRRQELGFRARLDINKFETLPLDMQKDIAKGTLKDLYHKDGNKGIVAASKYFGNILDDNLIKETVDEYNNEMSASMKNDWSDYGANRDVAPILADLKVTPDKFASMSYEDQQMTRKQLENEMGKLADKRHIDKNSPAYKLAVNKTLNEFSPMRPEIREAIKSRNENFSKPIIRSDGTRMYTSDLYKQPIDFYQKNRTVADELMFDKQTGEPTKFGQYMSGVMNGVKAGYAHPVFAEREMPTAVGISKVPPTESEVIGDLKGVIDSIPSQYRNQIFNDRLLNYVNSPLGNKISQNIQDYANDGVFQGMARQLGMNPSDQAQFDKLSKLVDKYSYNTGGAPVTPSDILNHAYNLESRLVNDRNMNEKDVDDMINSFADARGYDYASKLMRSRYDTLRDKSIDEGAATGIYKNNDGAEKRETAYEDYINKNGQYNNTAQPTLPRNYPEWRKYQLAKGGREALREIKLLKMSSGKEDAYNSMEDVVVDLLRNLSQVSGKPATISELDNLADPAQTQRAREYLKQMEDMAMTDPTKTLGGKYKSLLEGAQDYRVPKKPKGVGGEYLLSSPEQWSEYLSTASDGAAVLGTPPTINDSSQFNNMYTAVQSTLSKLQNKRRTPSEEGQMKALNYLTNAANQYRGQDWSQAKEGISSSLVNQMETENNIDNILQPGQESTYAEIAKKNPTVANSLNILRNIDPKKYHEIANTMHEVPGNIYNDMVSGKLLEPSSKERYKNYESRKATRDKIRAAFDDDATMEKYMGISRRDPNFQAYKQQVMDTVLSSEAGEVPALMLLQNPDDPRKIQTFGNNLRNTLLNPENGLALTPQDRLSLNDADIARIPNLKTQYKLREMKNILNQYGRPEDQAFFRNLKMGGDGYYYWGNNPQPLRPSDLYTMMETNKQQMKQYKELYGNI